VVNDACPCPCRGVEVCDIEVVRLAKAGGLIFSPLEPRLKLLGHRVISKYLMWVVARSKRETLIDFWLEKGSASLRRRTSFEAVGALADRCHRTSRPACSHGACIHTTRACHGGHTDGGHNARSEAQKRGWASGK
jgi:hypothetical protein